MFHIAILLKRLFLLNFYNVITRRTFNGWKEMYINTTAHFHTHSAALLQRSACRRRQRDEARASGLYITQADWHLYITEANSSQQHLNAPSANWTTNQLLDWILVSWKTMWEHWEVLMFFIFNLFLSSDCSCVSNLNFIVLLGVLSWRVPLGQVTLMKEIMVSLDSYLGK